MLLGEALGFETEPIMGLTKKEMLQSNRLPEKLLDTLGETDVGRSDDPVRMYLREMGGVELLSREGEIAIAKRIEAGKDVMLIALSQSPITANKVFEWKKKVLCNDLFLIEQ